MKRYILLIMFFILNTSFAIGPSKYENPAENDIQQMNKSDEKAAQWIDKNVPHQIIKQGVKSVLGKTGGIITDILNPSVLNAPGYNDIIYNPDGTVNKKAE